MYTEFYGFKEKPFNLVPNPSYLFLSSRHANALTFLEYGLSEKVGFVMLTGEIGMGKTTLVRHLLNQVEQNIDVAVIFNTNIQADDLIHLILIEFEVEFEEGISKSKALDLFYAFLIERYSKDRKVLLIIDEAQNLSGDVLEEIRMLSNLQTDDELLLQIMLVGQPELKDKISDPGLEQFAQRIAVSYHLAAMSLEETGEYITHRIEKAGGNANVFLPEAVKKIYEAATGIPRTINLLCDASLVFGYAEDKMAIDENIVSQVIEDKGGMGIFTKAKIKDYVVNTGSNDELVERLMNVENNLVRLNELYKTHIDEMESRAKFCRDALVAELKRNLTLEKRKKALLAVENERLKKKYSLVLNKNKNNGKKNYSQTVR